MDEYAHTHAPYPDTYASICVDSGSGEQRSVGQSSRPTRGSRMSEKVGPVH